MNRQQIEQLFARVERLEPVSDSELQALEQALQDDPALHEQLSGQRPPTAEAFVPEPPSAPDWEQTWDQIASRSVRTRRRIGAAWQPLAAAACVALLALTLRFSGAPLPTQRGPADDWELSLATGVTIDELEVFGNTTTYVAYDGDFDDPGTTAMIWVMSGDEDMGV